MAEVVNPTHVPVMRARIVELLAPALAHPGAVYLDGTLGLAGHASAILGRCPNARLIGIDRDATALDLAAGRLAGYGDRVRLYHAAYHELPQVLDEDGTTAVDAICLDLGLSSLQIDAAERGFAYAADAPLDMRMDTDQEVTAADLLNTASAAELTRWLREYGDEQFADRISRRIVAARAEHPIRTSPQLVTIVTDAIPAAARHARSGHPAKRTFQALRIAVNAELDSLTAVLPAALDALAPGGRIAVLAYHSGEDRLVKRQFARACADRVPPGLPAVPEALKAPFRPLTRGAERPEPDEIADNPRAASARLRAVARIQEVAV
ncbi:MAG: 16S rRNA (cytosine(1402)-N(4))-methyltransferase RsmH [Propionibacteriaceae bacterium]|nr:16S rRNA (cytosine(1402)-N(4))-methyltransferase RsmH [Propionibacteriaceae bacterium]